MVSQQGIHSETLRTDSSSQRLQRGVFISFEGPEGGGKSTQAELLAGDLRNRGHSVVLTREPGGTPLGEKLRALIKNWEGADAPCAQSELLLLVAARAQHVVQCIRPSLQKGCIVICDRFADSTTVYQGMGRGLDMDFIHALHQWSVGDCWPDITFFLDIDVKAGLQRAADRAGMEKVKAYDRFEAASREFHERIREGFLMLSREAPERIKRIPGGQPADTVHEQVKGFHLKQ